jgi:biopolymer transport protein ExbD
MTPMIDVVFLLIIFFIVSSNLVQQDVAMELELPSAESGERSKERDTRTITLNVPEEGILLLGTERVDVERLRAWLVREHQSTDKEIEVRIRTNKNIPYGAIEPVLVLCAESGIWNVSFAVTKDWAE